MKNYLTEQDVIDMFGDNLLKMLEYKRMTAAELSRACCLERSTISRYLSKERMPSMRALINICYVLDCNYEELLPTYTLVVL